ncbi:MAG: DNA-directed RNA polymerase subunit beta [Mycoplasmataceae bacterium RC_NB112A]|nr:MAG: DNA-directed RNA polymerase subunit beta [Mycoplasmataceae bacterium RC_NB112A]KLL01880.1 MAG: DNA-directed RNA polymerase subunit beta [Mycoplasmataceae bacterium RC_NB112A]
MLSYHLIDCGKNQRREYLSKNRSPLFQKLPERDFAHEQKKSYDDFLNHDLKKLFQFYFPPEGRKFENYNNQLWIKIEEPKYHEPEIDEEKARADFLTWSYSLSFTRKIIWNCKKIETPLIEKDWRKSIKEWVEDDFEVKHFDIQPLKKKPPQWDSYWEEKKTTESYWEVKESEGNLKIWLGAKLEEQNNLIIRFHCEWSKEEVFCYLPKMNSQGNFIINGFDKAVVFQSVRAPGVYFFSKEKNCFYGEIIPRKGPWIRIAYSLKHSRTIELKFPNSNRTFDLLAIFKTFAVPVETLEKIFSSEDLNLEDYPFIKPLENLPQFIFDCHNSYFDLGKLGRRRLNQRLNIFSLSIHDQENKLFLEKELLNLKKNPPLTIPHSTNKLYCLKIKSPRYPQKTISLVDYSKTVSEKKTYFDLADLIGVVSNYINLTHGLGRVDREEEKDNLENQVIRHIGNLVYNIFNTQLGVFLQHLQNRYLAYISQLKKIDLLKAVNLKDFLDYRINNFFNLSPLVQLQNQNNPLAEISYIRKLSVLGLGGFGSTNATLNARNINPSYYGRYDLVETPEGPKVGLIHNLALGAKINDYEQVITPYYKVKKGKVTSEIDYLSNEEEKNKYITHFDLEIDEKNQILEDTPLARYQNDIVSVPKERIDYIDSSFYQMNSLTSATIPFFQHNDATRMLMATNMQRQAVTLLKSQTPLIATGIEKSLLDNSPLLIKAQAEGEVEYRDSQQIKIKEKKGTLKTYKLKQLVVSNKNVLNFSIPLVKKGEKVKVGQVIASGDYNQGGELALGYNLRAAYLCWKGYNYEDAIVISEKLVKEDILTSFFAKKHTIIRYNTEQGPEKFSSYFPRSEKAASNLDKEGFIKVGSRVKGGDVLVGKWTPKIGPRGDEAPEEELFREMFGQNPNSSLYLPKGEEGIVYEVRKRDDEGAREWERLDKKQTQIEKKIEDGKMKMSSEKNATLKKKLKELIQTSKEELKKITEQKKKIKKLEEIEVYVAHQRKIEIGDKLTTRFGNKGVVAKIVPESDMPFDEKGETIDIIFNPLSIPTRMNIGQLFETVLASAAHKLDFKLLVRPFNTPSLKTIEEILDEAKIKEWGNQKLFDGQTGLPFQQKIYQGIVYVIKLNHMVLDKFHFRATGPYSMIYQQPLKGRAQDGGQRMGEMENGVLMALGAAYNLMEMMGSKSDDIYKRRQLQNSFLFGNYQIDLRSNKTESFNLLLQYCWGIGFGLQAVDHRGRTIDL